MPVCMCCVAPSCVYMPPSILVCLLFCVCAGGCWFLSIHIFINHCQCLFICMFVYRLQQEAGLRPTHVLRLLWLESSCTDQGPHLPDMDKRLVFMGYMDKGINTYLPLCVPTFLIRSSIILLLVSFSFPAPPRTLWRKHFCLLMDWFILSFHASLCSQTCVFLCCLNARVWWCLSLPCSVSSVLGAFLCESHLSYVTSCQSRACPHFQYFCFQRSKCSAKETNQTMTEEMDTHMWCSAWRARSEAFLCGLLMSPSQRVAFVV